MGYFDAMVSSSFKTDPQGRVHFFPWGACGRGFVLPTNEEAAALKRAHLWFCRLAVPGIIVLVTFAPFWVSLGVCALDVALYTLWARRRTRRLQRSDVRLTLSESTASQAEHMPKLMIWFFFTLSSLFTVGGLWVLVFHPARWALGVVCVSLFGFGTWSSWQMLLAKRENG